MFLKSKRTYDRDGGQKAAGLFLWIVQGPGVPFRESRAFIRSVTMHQCGHFMTGQIRVGGHVATVSGTYGGDGLPCDVPAHVYDAAVPIPAEIMEIYATGGGHNGAGREGPDLHAWALANLPVLRRAGQKLPTNGKQRIAMFVTAPGTTRHPVALRIDAFRSATREIYDLPENEIHAWFRRRRVDYLEFVHVCLLGVLGLTDAEIAAKPWKSLDKLEDLVLHRGGVVNNVHLGS